MLKNILLVNDDELVTQSIVHLLEASGLSKQITTTINGREAMQYLLRAYKNRESQDLPELILLDIHMPEQDGFDFLSDYISYFSHSRRIAPIYIVSVDNSDKVRKIPSVFRQVKGVLTLPLTPEDVSRIMGEASK